MNELDGKNLKGDLIHSSRRSRAFFRTFCAGAFLDLCIRRDGPRASSQMLVLGSDGTMQPEGGKVAVYRKRGGPVKIVEAESGGDRRRLDGTYRQYLAFRDNIRSGKQPVCDGEAGKQAAKIGLLAEKSIREQKIVSWDDLPG